jgi:hypothetical protein
MYCTTTRIQGTEHVPKKSKKEGKKEGKKETRVEFYS